VEWLWEFQKAGWLPRWPMPAALNPVMTQKRVAGVVRVSTETPPGGHSFDGHFK